MPILALDTETDQISVGNLAPDIVCASYSCGETRGLLAVGDGKEKLRQLFEASLTRHTVYHNAPFDLAVFCRQFPDMLPAVFKALKAGLVHDTMIREKLILLHTTGDSENDAMNRPISYSLAALAERYLGRDISKGKEAVDSWRKQYSLLKAMPATSWPAEATEYAISDAVYTEQIHDLQEARRQAVIQQVGKDPFYTETFHTTANFCLHLMSCKGMAIDGEEVAKVEALIAKERTPESMSLLIEHGIVIPAVPAQPYANGAKNSDGTLKMKAAVPEKTSRSALQSYVVALSKRNPEVEVAYTAPTDKFPQGQVQVDDEFLEDYYHLDPVLTQYRQRKVLDKLVSTYLPALKFDDGPLAGQVSPIVHGSYDALKRTYRTSSFAPKEGKKKLYPSFNVQNQDPRIRNCIVARPGKVLCSTDYGSLELCTFAQKNLNLFGRSVMANILNDGIDPHEFLGAQIAAFTEPGFDGGWVPSGNDRMETYRAFHRFKDSESQVHKDFWKKYRTLAKPTGLGFPGGLGPKTFVTYAKVQYEIILTESQATDLRKIWTGTFEEAEPYFKWVNNECLDPINKSREVNFVDEFGQKKSKVQKLYSYTTPFGGYRAGCDYCACANGAALQSFAADGAKLAVINLVEACYTGNLRGLVDPLAFIHDETITEIVDGDREWRHAAAFEVGRIMVEAMKVVCPDVKIKAVPALMGKWDKGAETVYDADGYLDVWQPKPKKEGGK